MFAVEIGVPQQVLAIDDAVKVGNSTLGNESVAHVNMCPQGWNDEVHVLYAYDLVIVVVDIWSNFTNYSVLHGL